MTIKLLFSYGVYFLIIIIGLLVLGILKKKTRLPKHADFKKMLENFEEKLSAVIALKKNKGDNNYNFFKRITSLIMLNDKLIYTASVLAEKERDVQIATIASYLEEVKVNLVPYKFGKKGQDDASGLRGAQRKIKQAISLIDKVLERDKELYQRRAKR